MELFTLAGNLSREGFHLFQLGLEGPDFLVVGLEDGGQLSLRALEPVQLVLVSLQCPLQQPVLLCQLLFVEKFAM